MTFIRCTLLSSYSNNDMWLAATDNFILSREDSRASHIWFPMHVQMMIIFDPELVVFLWHKFPQYFFITDNRLTRVELHIRHTQLIGIVKIQLVAITLIQSKHRTSSAGCLYIFIIFPLPLTTLLHTPTPPVSCERWDQKSQIRLVSVFIYTWNRAEARNV